jgi:hypothetical protein
VGLGLSWGDGYAHHRALLDSAKAVSDPTAFFDSLVRLLRCISAMRCHFTVSHKLLPGTPTVQQMLNVKSCTKNDCRM